MGAVKMPNYLSELEKRGLTLTEYARRVGISPTYAASVFRGKKPSADVERRMMAELQKCPWCERKWPHPVPIEE